MLFCKTPVAPFASLSWVSKDDAPPKYFYFRDAKFPLDSATAGVTVEGPGATSYPSAGNSNAPASSLSSIASAAIPNGGLASETDRTIPT